VIVTVLQCPDSATKKDLVAYLERISLYCHQLNITSKVKADVQNISGELIVSGVRTCVCLCVLLASYCHEVAATAISCGFMLWSQSTQLFYIWPS